MLAEIPRKPTFPDHMISSVIARIENDVQNDVIPVSAGIYSEYKLKQKLEAIPKPLIVDYNDPIFFDLADYQSLPCKSKNCPGCNQQYGNKKNVPVQCKFCGVWLCSQCICPRKRYHPRAKQSNSPRYQICYKCDDKFLSLTLNHSYVESKALLDQAINKVREQKNNYQRECEKRQQDDTVTKDMVAKNKFKISSMKKEKIDLGKGIANLRRERQDLLFKIQIRQKYVIQIKERLQKVKKLKQEKLEQETQITRNQQSKQDNNNNNQSKELKLKRAFTQNIVISEAIFQQKVAIQQQEAVQEEQQIEIQQETKKIIQTTVYQFTTLKDSQQSRSQQKVQNFFNFHEWGRNQADTQQPTNSPKQQTLVKSFEEETIVGQNLASPSANISIDPNQSEDAKASFARKRLAEIFKKQEKQEVQLQYQQLSESQSLDAEVIESRRKDVMKAAILQSQFQRFSTDQYEAGQANPAQKCTCDIF